MELGEALIDATQRLSAAGVASPEFDARAIAAHLTGDHHLMLDRRGAVPDDFWELIARREAREPLQHIVGSAAFGHLDVEVGPGVFIPRPETEILADWAVRTLKAAGDPAPTVVDLCTGSGVLAQYIASFFPRATVLAVEKQGPALDYAQRNAPDVTVLRGDVCQPILGEHYGTVDLVVSNPPYVPRTPGLEPEVYADPDDAVFGGDDGMDVIRAMTPLVCALLAPGGRVGIEHDDSTSEAVQRLLSDAGLIDVAPLADLTGRMRFVTASKLDPARSPHERYAKKP